MQSACSSLLFSKGIQEPAKCPPHSSHSMHLTHSSSHLRENYFKFCQQPHQKYYITQYEGVDFHSLLIRRKMIIRLPIPTTSLTHFSSLTLSLPRVINFKFLLQPHHKCYTTQYEELGFSSLTQMKDDYTINSHYLTYTFSL